MSPHQGDMTIEDIVMFSGISNGALGRIVLIKVREQETLIQADLYIGQEKPASTIAKKKKTIFEEVVATVNVCLDGL